MPKIRQKNIMCLPLLASVSWLGRFGAGEKNDDILFCDMTAQQKRQISSRRCCCDSGSVAVGTTSGCSTTSAGATP